METILERVARLVESEKNAIATLRSINNDLSNEEHVDSSWIKDTIEIVSGMTIVERSNFNIENKKLKAEIQSLKQQLADADKVIDEVTSRCVYTYCNTQCRSTRERVIEIAKLCERYKSKYKVDK